MVITCYVDEAGCPGRLPSASSPVQPFLILAAVALRSTDINTFTRQVNRLKVAYLEGLRPGQPSAADRGLTCELKEALAHIDVRVLDHFVVAGNRAVSMAERGLV